MDNPTAEIATAINRCAGADTADNQITAFEHYFTTDSSFLHPLCYVPSGHDSRKRIIGIYLFYRGVVPNTSFEIQTTALDPKTLHLYVDLIQRPEVRIWRLFQVPTVPMHIHFQLRKVGDKYYIKSQEDLIQMRVSARLPSDLSLVRAAVAMDGTDWLRRAF